MAAWIKATGNGLVRAWLYVAGVFGILKTAAVSKSWSCIKKCWRGHVCGQPLVYRSGSGLGFHWECASCEEKILINRVTCDHSFNVSCGVLQSYGPEGSNLEEKTEDLLAQSPCEEIVDWKRSCGHVVKGIQCCDKLRQMQNNAKCNEVVVNYKRDCGHEVPGIACSKLQEGLKKCTKLVTWTRKCGHVLKDIHCYKKTNIINSNIGCSETVFKKLSCGHEVKCECCKEKAVKDSDCGRILTSKFPCGHLLRRLCPEPKQKKCDVIITTLKCSHAAKRICPGTNSSAPPPACAENCDQILKCGHRCSGTCMHSGDHTCSWKNCDKKCPKGHSCTATHDCSSDCPPCSVRVTATHPGCEHEMTVVCGDNLAKRKIQFCSSPCKIQNKCGHLCSSACGNHLRIPKPGCQGLSQLVCPGCREKDHGQLLPCGHVCKASCSSHYVNGKFACPPCKERNVEKMCAKGHHMLCECESVADYCQEPTEVTLKYSCVHSKVITAPCSLPLSEKVDTEARKSVEDLQQPVIPAINCSSACGIYLGGCGHTCLGKCANCHKTWLHPRCAQKHNDILPCGHKTEFCDEIANNDFCRKQCSIKCSHSACFDDCGLPCAACTEPCERGCCHGKCAKKCFEPCDFKLCTERCSEVLPCGHHCCGFCGEKCPPCANCHQDELARLNRNFMDRDLLEVEIYVLLPDCGHAIASTILDKIMCGELDLEENKKNNVGLKRCPGADCGAIIWNCNRYWRFLAPILDNYNAYKASKLADVKTYEEIYKTFPKLKKPPEGQRMLVNLKTFIESKLYLPPDEKYQRGLKVMRTEVSYLEINSLKLLHCVYASLTKMLNVIDKVQLGVSDAAKYNFVVPLRPFLSKIETLQWPLHPQEIADIKQQIRKFIYSFILMMCVDDHVIRLIDRGVPKSETELKYYVDVLMTPNRLSETDDQKLKRMFKVSTLLKVPESGKFAQATYVANKLAEIMDF